jgi:hypothetical protein
LAESELTAGELTEGESSAGELTVSGLAGDRSKDDLQRVEVLGR